MSTDRDSVKRALSAADFPASKDALLEHVARRSGDGAVLRALRAMPPVQYGSLGEVLQSVPVGKAAEEGQSDSDKAQQQRHNTQSGLAEHETEIPSNPIVEELGENRGS